MRWTWNQEQHRQRGTLLTERPPCVIFGTCAFWRAPPRIDLLARRPCSSRFAPFAPTAFLRHPLRWDVFPELGSLCRVPVLCFSQVPGWTLPAYAGARSTATLAWGISPCPPGNARVRCPYRKGRLTPMAKTVEYEGYTIQSAPHHLVDGGNGGCASLSPWTITVASERVNSQPMASMRPNRKPISTALLLATVSLRERWKAGPSWI